MAALMVAYGHAGYFGWVPLIRGCATIGVILFFFLSGFLMGHHYLPSAKDGVFNRRSLAYWSAFLLRRFVRVYPPYFFAPIVGYLLLMPRMPPDFERMQAPGIVPIGDAFARLATFQGELGIYWTVEVELFFYLVYPLIAAACVLSRNRTGTLVLIFATLVVLKHILFGPVGIAWSESAMIQWAGYVSIFVAGVCAAAAAKDWPGLLVRMPASPNALTRASSLALIAVIALVALAGGAQETIWRFEWVFAALFFVLFAGLLHSDGVLARMLSSRAFMILGRVSYSLYLMHIIAYYVVIRLFSHHDALKAAVSLFVLTTLFYLIFERPFVRLSKRIVVGERREAGLAMSQA